MILPDNHSSNHLHCQCTGTNRLENCNSVQNLTTKRNCIDGSIPPIPLKTKPLNIEETVDLSPNLRKSDMRSPHPIRSTWIPDRASRNCCVTYAHRTGKHLWRTIILNQNKMWRFFCCAFLSYVFSVAETIIIALYRSRTALATNYRCYIDDSPHSGQAPAISIHIGQPQIAKRCNKLFHTQEKAALMFSRFL